MGGGGSTKQTTRENSTSTVTLPAWMTQAGQDLFGRAMSADAAHPVTPYTKQIAAGMAPNQSQAGQKAAANVNAGQSELAAANANAAGAAAGQGARVASTDFDSTQAARYMSPYLQDVQARTVAEMERQNAMERQDLGDRAAGMKAYGGTRHAVLEGEMARGQNANIMDYLARSNQAGFENAQQTFASDRAARMSAAEANANLDQAELDRRLSAGGLQGDLSRISSGVNSEGILNLLRTGQVAQDTEQNELGSAYDEFLRMQDAPVGRYADLMAVLSGAPRNVTTTSKGTSTTKGSQSGDPLSTALAVASLGASIFSDVALKENLVPLPGTMGGVPLFAFDYRKGTGLPLPEGRQVGVIAQDVERLRPDAMGPVVEGFKTVNYRKLMEASHGVRH